MHRYSLIVWISDYTKMFYTANITKYILHKPIEKAPNPLRQLKTKPSAQEFCIQTKQLENQLITKHRFILLKRPFSQIKQRFIPTKRRFKIPRKNSL